LTSRRSGYIRPLWWFGSYFSRHSWQQYVRWYENCPSGAIETCCCAWGELLQPLMVDVPKVYAHNVPEFEISSRSQRVKSLMVAKFAI
jgi:hypothetical protein